jgi:bisphosphoglycerate-independent phosphoglycerate mutase (AlkP superfamily)
MSINRSGGSLSEAVRRAYDAGQEDEMLEPMVRADAAGRRLFIHSFIGRRNDMPETGAVYVEKVEDMAREHGVGEVATVMGRYWPPARANTPDRVEKAYRALVHGEGLKVPGNFSS